MAKGQAIPSKLESAEAQVQRSARHWPVILLITLLALGIRMAGLGSKGLWIDEADSVYFASQSFSDILYRLCDPHPPGYYILLSGFLSLGRSEFWVRLPSAIAGTLSIPLLYALSRELAAVLARWLDRRTGILACLLLAVAPLHVWYAQEARAYALTTTLGVCAAYFALRVARHVRAGDTLGYVFVSAACLYSDQSSLLPLLLANLLWVGLWIWNRSQGTKSGAWELLCWMGLQLIVGLTFWLWWSRALFPSRFEAGTLYQLTMVRLTLQRFGLSISLTELEWVMLLGAVILLGIGAWVTWLLVRHVRVRKLWSILAPLVLVLFLLFTMGSAIPRLFTLKRLLLGLLPFGLLICAMAIQELGLERRQLAALVGFSLALSAVNLLWVPKEPWREVVSVVQQELGPGDTLWVDELAVPAFDYYYRGSHERSVWRATHLRDLEQDADVSQGGWTGEGQIWVVALVDPYRNLLDYLPAAWEAAWSADWHRVSVRAYEKPSVAASAGVAKPVLPAWLSAWPSPVHEACRSEQ
jgi:hypothetical protein